MLNYDFQRAVVMDTETPERPAFPLSGADDRDVLNVWISDLISGMV